jgi:hypothetical protein
VAGRFGHNSVGFREGAREIVCGGVIVVHHGAGQGWHRVGSMVPCRCASRAGLGGVLVHGNVMHALGALDSMSTTLGHG